jgi:hypothetical protein
MARCDLTAEREAGAIPANSTIIIWADCVRWLPVAEPRSASSTGRSDSCGPRPVPVAKPLSSGFDGVATRPIEPKRKANMTSPDKIARRKLSLLERKRPFVPILLPAG